jgi:O-antigen ligase
MAAVVAGAVLLDVLSVLQALTGNYENDYLGLAGRAFANPGAAPVPESRMGLEDRAQGPVGDANRFAQILLMALPLALIRGLNAPTTFRAMAALASVAILLGGVLVTYSRGAFLTLVVLTFLMVPLRLLRTRGLALLLAAGVLLVPIIAPGYVARVASISGAAALFGHAQVEADGPTRGRTTEMLAALAAYTEHPVLGVGPGQYVNHYSVYYQSLPEISIRELAEPRRAHNLYLEIAAESGTFGLAIFVAIPLLLLRDLRVVRLSLYERSATELGRIAAGFSLVVLAYLGTGVFLHLAFERYYWFIVALTAAAAGVLEREARRVEIETSWTSWRHGSPTV